MTFCQKTRSQSNSDGFDRKKLHKFRVLRNINKLYCLYIKIGYYF